MSFRPAPMPMRRCSGAELPRPTGKLLRSPALEPLQHQLHQSVPVAMLGLSQQCQAGIPGAVQAMAQPALAGLYHCAAAGQTSWHGYAQFVLQEARSLGMQVKVAPGRVLPITSAQYPVAATRPLNSRLDCSRFQNNFSIHLPFWQFGVRRILQEIAEMHQI